MTELNDKMDKISGLLSTIEHLVSEGKLTRKGSRIYGDLVVETIYDDESSIVVIEKGKRGQSFPVHAHIGAVQYLICVRGRFSISIAQTNIMKIIGKKECFTVPENMEHSVLCLEDDSKLIGVVIPVEPAYRKG